jgi:DNA-binding response OmpR family regulator
MPEENKVKILIVKDEEIINKAYADKLRNQGFLVVVAKNGQEGLALALSEKPDLILLDILMPVMDGLAMMDALRNKNAYGKQVPIIFLTNLSASEERIMKAIVDGQPAYYLVKSNWDISQVLEKIKERLSRK